MIISLVLCIWEIHSSEKDSISPLAFIVGKFCGIERLLSISRRTEEGNYRTLHNAPEAFYLAAKRSNASTEPLCLHTDEATRGGLIALEASLRRVFFPNFVTAAVICSRLFVHSLHRFACRDPPPPTFDFVSTSYDSESPQVRLRRRGCEISKREPRRTN